MTETVDPVEEILGGDEAELEPLRYTFMGRALTAEARIAAALAVCEKAESSTRLRGLRLLLALREALGEPTTNEGNR